MGFNKKTWKNRVVQYPLRRLLTIVRDFDTTGTGVMDIQREDGEITEEGDAFSAANMNDLESRIETGIEGRLEKVTTMPTASADLLDVSVIYVGATDSNYTEGNTYKCKLVNGNYTWVQIGAAQITVDSAMSATSKNPVQNKVVNAAISAVDTTATNAASTASSAASTASSAASTASRALNIARSTSNFPTGDAYSSSSAYKVGDMVIYNNKLYRCKTACSAASWSVNANNFESISLASAITDLNNELNDKNKNLLKQQSGKTALLTMNTDYTSFKITMPRAFADKNYRVFLTAENSNGILDALWVHPMSERTSSTFNVIVYCPHNFAAHNLYINWLAIHD